MPEELSEVTFIDAIGGFDEKRIREIKREIALKRVALYNSIEKSCDRHGVHWGLDQQFDFAEALCALADHLGVRLMLRPMPDRLTPHLINLFIEDCKVRICDPTPEGLMDIFAVRLKHEAEIDFHKPPPQWPTDSEEED